MSVAEITGRIAQIQAQLAMLVPPGSTAAPGASASSLAASRVLGGTSTTGSTEFADWLAQSVATDDLGTNASAPPTSTGETTGARVVAEAQRYLGLPYVWGGDDPADGGMDCSGLVQHVYSSLGIDLPRVSADQARAGTAVASMAEAQPGDLIAWDRSGRNVGADHIAIYVGNGQMIEAPRTGLDIRMVEVTDPPDYIRRVIPEAAPVAARATASTPYADLFNGAASRYGVSAELLAAVARQESSFDPRAVSPAGAQGLMQLMPGTAAGLGVSDPFDPAQAVDGAARLLKQLLERFGSVDLALAGYNAGPGAVLRYDGVPPYPETQNYVRSVLAQLNAAGAA